MSSPQYGAAHRARRKQAIARLVPGTPCPASGPPMYPTPSAAVAVGLLAAFGRLHLDHRVPVAMGGANGATRLQAKSNWRWIDRLAEDDGAVAAEFGFRIGGRERFGFKRHGRAFRYDARYYDIVPDQRIIYSYEFYADDARISVSVTTIEFVMNGDGTALTWTEQGAFLDGFDGNEAPGLRREGTAILLDHLPGYLNSRGPR
jgi:uncharacterized protein YndB with AHSA1/START domain